MSEEKFTATRAPATASAAAMPPPMPFEAPVMIATFPANLCKRPAKTVRRVAPVLIDDGLRDYRPPRAQ
jgi:hypothetical protein